MAALWQHLINMPHAMHMYHEHSLTCQTCINGAQLSQLSHLQQAIPRDLRPAHARSCMTDLT
jgi:hypothetical protein